MDSPLFPRLLIIFACSVHLSFTQLPQFLQFQMQAVNRANDRGTLTSAFMMSQGHQNSDPEFGQYITFETMQFSSNAVTYREFGAFQSQTPGLYFMSFTVRGSTTGALVQLRGPRGAIYSTAFVPDDSQVTSNSLVLLRRNETIYLEIIDGGIFENTMNNGSYNSFMGILLVAESSNPFLQNVFGNSNLNPNNVQDVGTGFGNNMGNSFNIPFAN